MADSPKPQSKPAHSIADLRIYQLALSLETQVFELVKELPETQFDLGNDLRRASAGVAHYIYDAHRRYSYKAKVECLHAARDEAELVIKLLTHFEESKFGPTQPLKDDFTTLIKQSWGLIKWLRTRQTAKDQAASTAATDQLVEARASSN